MVEDHDIDHGVYAYAKSESFGTIKDHKEIYIKNTKCRRVNQTGFDKGKVTKKFLSRLVTSLQLQQ